MKLGDMKQYLDMLLESFSSVLNLDMTVLNAKPFERIAWTGSYWQSDIMAYDEKGNVTTRWKNSYTYRVIQSGEPMIVENTEEYINNWSKLSDYSGSAYYSLILYPILGEQEIEGVIVISSFDEIQQKTLLTRKKQLLKYLGILSDLISSKLKELAAYEQERIISEQLHSVISTIQDGIILFSKDDKILQINSYAENALHFEEEEIRNRLLMDVVNCAREARHEDNRQPRTTEIHRTISEIQYSLQITTYPVDDGNDTVLCVVCPFSKIQNCITQNDDNSHADREIIFFSQKMSDLVRQTEIIAKNSFSVLIAGESGTGKELFARRIHFHSSRKDQPFVYVNCAAIPETLLESELFGYADGAFTGARKGGKIGKFLLANHGTLFLDEIGEMPLFLQAKLLRVLGERKVDVVGGSAPVDIDVRIIAATNRNLEEMIHTKEFRADLYYRLCAISVNIPPLRERKEDIYILSRYFISKYNTILQKEVRGISDSAFLQMQEYDWPGNVRELENCIEYMMTFESGAYLSESSIPSRIIKNLSARQNFHLCVGEKICCDSGKREIFGRSLKEILEEKEREVLEEYAARYGGHPSKKEVGEICNQLGIGISSYYRKLKQK